jgi:c-di-AMP phosphodiesterase-like protein
MDYVLDTIKPQTYIQNNRLNIIENKNAILKLLTCLIILILIFKKQIFGVIFICFVMIFIEIFNQRQKGKHQIKKEDQTNNLNKSNIKCRKSTIDNPMGNILLYTPIEEQNIKFCANDEELIKNNLMHNVYFNEKDLFLKKENMRPFITMPSETNPNAIDDFKKYLYDFDNSTCKIDKMNCMYNEDLRYHKTHFVE